MGVVKVIPSKSGATLKGLKASLNYIFRQDKSEEQYRAVTGPFEADKITPTNVYNAFVHEQELWHKTQGRTYAHYVLSWHKDEAITPDMALDIGKEFAEDFFKGHQVAIAIHTNRDHIHCHAVSNSVSYVDGKKLHLTRQELEYAKHLNDELCYERGLSITKAGYHYDGTKIERGQVSSYNNRQYRMLSEHKNDSYVNACYRAVRTAITLSSSKDEFINSLKNLGWSCNWSDSRTHIVFTDDEGHKIRASRLGKIFNEDFSKEGLEKMICSTEKIQENQTEKLEQQSEEIELEDFEENYESNIDLVGVASLIGTTARAVEKKIKKERKRNM